MLLILITILFILKFGSQKLQVYAKQASELDKIVRKMVLESLGVEKYLEEHIESTKCLLRMMKYKGPQTTETKKLGLITHTDKEVITVLYHSQVDGLEVQIQDGQWISVQRNLPDSFIVMCGDSLYVSSFIFKFSLFHFKVITYQIKLTYNQFLPKKKKN